MKYNEFRRYCKEFTKIENCYYNRHNKKCRWEAN